MQEVSVRDDLARALSEGLTSKPVRTVPDPALTLPPASKADAARLLRSAGVPADGSPVVGVALRRWFHQRRTLIPHKYAVKYGLRRVGGAEPLTRMIALLAEALDRLVEEKEAHVLFMPTYNVAHEGDDRISDAVLDKMKTRRKSLIRISDPRIYKAVAGRLSVMLAGRMHAAIFAAAMGTPVVGLSYNQKFEGFFRLIESEDRLLEIEDFVRNERTGELTGLLSDEIDRGRGIHRRVGELADTTRRFTAAILNSSTTTS